jgi:hypothetical protein
MTKYKYFKSKNYRSNVNLVVESDIVEVSDQTSEGGTTPTLQEVTDEGAVTTNAIEVGTRIIVNDAGGDGDEVMKFNYDTDQGEPRFVFENQDGGKFELTFAAPASGTKTLIYSEESGVSAVSKTVNANFTAFNFASYTAIANLTATDPSPIEGGFYTVFVQNGTTTIGGVGYTSGNLIYRFYQGGAWSSTVFGVSAPINTATQTALDLKLNKNKFFGVKDITITGVTVPTVVVSLLVPANRFTSNEFVEIIVHSNKSTTATGVIVELYHDTVINGTSNTIVNAISLATTSRNCHFSRWLSLNGTSLKNTVAASNSQLFPYSNASATSAVTTFDPTIDNYFTLVVNGLTVVSENYVLNFLQIRSYSL